MDAQRTNSGLTRARTVRGFPLWTIGLVLGLLVLASVPVSLSAAPSPARSPSLGHPWAPATAPGTPALSGSPPAFTRGTGSIRPLPSMEARLPGHSPVPSTAESPLAGPSVVATLTLPNDTLLQGNPTLPTTFYANSVAYAANVHAYYAVSGANGGSVLVINPSSEHVLTTILVGGFPEGIVYDPNNHLLYIANSGTGGPGWVDVVNPVTNTAGVSIPLGASGVGASGIAYDPATKLLYVPEFSSNNLSVVDPLSSVVVGLVPVGSGPDGVAIDPSAGRVYVANLGSDNVTIVNASTFTVVGSVAVGSEPASLDVALSTHQVFVANFNSSNVSVLEAGRAKVNQTISLPHGSLPYGVLYDPARNTVWVGGIAGPSAEVLSAVNGAIDTMVPSGGIAEAFAYASDRNEVGILTSANNLSRVSDLSDAALGQVSLGAAPNLVLWDAVTGSVFASDLWSPTLWVVDEQTDQLSASWTLPAPARALALTPNGTELFVGTGGDTNITVLNASTGAVVRSDPLGDPGGIGGFLFLGDQLFVSESRGVVVALNSTTLSPLATFGVGGAPTSMVGDGSLQLVYLINSNESNLTVFSNASDAVVGSVSLSQAAAGIAFEPGLGGHVFVSIPSNDEVDTITAGTFVVSSSLTIPNSPGALLYNPSLGDLFVSQGSSDTVAILNASTFVVAGSLVTGSGPEGLAFSPYTGELYVAAALNTALSIASIVPAGVIPPFAASSWSIPASVEVGQTTTIVVSSTLRPWSLGFVYTGLPTGCTGSNTPRLVCTPSQPGNYTLHVAVTGPLSQTVDTSYVLVVAPRVSATLTAKPAAFTIGGTTTLSVVPVNATGTAHVGWLALPAGCSGAPHAFSVTCRPSTTGTVNATAFVSDGWGAWVESNLSFKVNVLPKITAFSPSLPDVVEGSTITFNATISGGTAPYTIVYSGLPPGCPGANSSGLACTPSGTGTFAVTILVTDASGVTAEGNTTLNVSAKPATGTLLGLSYLDWGVLGLVIVILVVLVVLLTRRRPKPSAPAPSAPPPPSSGPSEVVYGEGETPGPTAPSPAEEPAPVTPAPAPPPAPPAPPRAAPSPPPRPVVKVPAPPTSTPRVSSAAPARGPAAGSTRPPIKCGNCGTMNEPWLTNCRWCKRPLAFT